eukprot:16005445-Heterocapsa_arctica.AAC.1
MAPENLDFGAEGFTNYQGIDEDQLVADELARFCGLGYLKRLCTMAECKAYLGAEPVLSRFGLIVREKLGKTKRRLILDVKQSRVKYSTRRTHR